MYNGLSEGITSLLLGGIIVGVCSLLTLLCYWAFGDSRRPYSKEMHAVLEPTYAYYSSALQSQIISALENNDEKALDAIKRQAIPDLALVRYSDKEERVFYSQLTRVEGKRYVPLTDIIIIRKSSLASDAIYRCGYRCPLVKHRHRLWALRRTCCGMPMSTAE